MKLSNNKQLHDYLASLSTKLRDHKSYDLSSVVADAAGLAWTIPDTEFLGESRTALTRVLGEANSILNEAEYNELLSVIDQLNEAFDRR